MQLKLIMPSVWAFILIIFLVWSWFCSINSPHDMAARSPDFTTGDNSLWIHKGYCV